MNKLKNFAVLGTLLALPISSFAGGADDNMLGVWGSVTLQGGFTTLSPSLSKLKWQLMNQTRTRDDSPKGTRETEDLLFSQLGYQVNTHASIWAGYVHDWINTPLDKPGYQESRPYQDFVWNQDIGSFNFMSRTRMEERINESNIGPQTNGYRARQLFQVSHALPFVKGLSAYVGNEVLGYVNKNTWGKQAFSEDRITSGLSYQITPQVGADLGYLGQYVDSLTGPNLFTHNIQANLRFKF